MADVIGPIIAILLIFGVYWVAQNLDVLGDTKRARLDIRKTEAKIRQEEAKTRQEEARVRARELEVEMGRLAIEARRLDYNPTGATEAEFRVLKELEDKKKDDDESG